MVTFPENFENGEKCIGKEEVEKKALDFIPMSETYSTDASVVSYGVTVTNYDTISEAIKSPNCTVDLVGK